MAEEVKSSLFFAPCTVCGGFGYEVTPNKTHIRCTRCQDNPSMYVVHESELLYWGKGASEAQIKQRRAEGFLELAINVLLLLGGIGGLVFFVINFIFWNPFRLSLGEMFSTPQPRMALFWVTLLFDAFLYYRLTCQTTSQRKIAYNPAASSKRERQHQFKIPANPTYEKFQKMPVAFKKDISVFFSQETLDVINAAFSLAKKLGQQQVMPLYLFGALLNSATITIILGRLGIRAQNLAERFGAAMRGTELDTGHGIDLGREAQEILFYAYEQARQQKRPYVDVMELMLALSQRNSYIKEMLFDLEIDEQMLQNVVEWIYMGREMRWRYRQWSKKAVHKPTGVMNRAMTARPVPFLDSLSQDFTSIAVRGGFFPMIGRASEMDQLLRLLREHTGGVLLVGPPGVGTTTMLEGFAELMATEDVPAEMQDKRFLVINPSVLVADAKGTGVIEGRLQRIVNEIARAGNIILGIENIQNLLSIHSASGQEGVADILLNGISRGLVKVVATTTSKAYQELITLHEGFLQRFQVIKVEEPERNDAILVCAAKSSSIEYKHKVYFTYAAIVAAVDLATRFLPERHLPAKALDIMAEAAALVGSRGERKIVTKEDIATVISEKTNVQVSVLTAAERDKLLNLEQLMHQRIVGQDVAVNAVAAALRRAREGLRDLGRPIASFLFLGPTGVGKTETAKTIAEVYFGDENNMIRIDMSEYQRLDSLRNLIGAKGEQGFLTAAVRAKPFSIVLLDELEKAHHNILNVFLQILDDGRVTDGLGNVINMTNTMIIATSNAATSVIQNYYAAGLDAVQIKNQLLEETLPQIFPPEFLNRFDDIVVFKPLTFREVLDIAQRMINKVGLRLLNEKGIALDVQPEAVIDLAKRGYDPKFGARPLRRVIQDTVDDGLAKLLISQQLTRRDIVVLKPGGVMEVQKAPKLT